MYHIDYSEVEPLIRERLDSMLPIVFKAAALQDCHFTLVEVIHHPIDQPPIDHEPDLPYVTDMYEFLVDTNLVHPDFGAAQLSVYEYADFLWRKAPAGLGIHLLMLFVQEFEGATRVEYDANGGRVGQFEITEQFVHDDTFRALYDDIKGTFGDSFISEALLRD